MVKLQKRFAYDYKGKEYYKHVVTIPDEIIKKLGWEEGVEIEQMIRNNQLVFQLKKDNVEVKYKS